MTKKPAKSKKAAQSHAAELEKRVSQIFDLLMNGMSRRQICQFASKNTDWDVDPRTIDRYIARANEEIRRIGRADRELEMVKTHARLHELYMRCLRIQDYKTCLSVQKEIALLYGLHEPVRFEVEMVDRYGDVIVALLAGVLKELQLSPEQESRKQAVIEGQLAQLTEETR